MAPLSPPAGSPSSVTVVVATRNRWEDLRASLPRHPRPVLLVDNGSTDGSPDLVRSTFPDVTVVELGRNHGAVARNVGVELARTPYVAFADDDSWWAPGALLLAQQVLDEFPRLAVLAASVLVGLEERADPICAALASSPLPPADDLPGPPVLGFLSCGAVVRRDAFLHARGFDDVVFFMGEEERLALDLAALGWGLAYVSRVVAHHHPSPARDRRAREIQAARNRLLTTVLRRPWPVVLAVLREQLATPVGRQAALRAVPRLRRALARRRPLPPAVEQARALLDEPDSTSSAPRAAPA